MDITQTVRMADTFGLLSDPTRVSIVMTCMDQEISAGEIAQKLDVSPPLVSHHLRLLRTAHILNAERRGKHVFYSMADECVRSILKTMIHHLFHHPETSHPPKPLEGEA